MEAKKIFNEFPSKRRFKGGVHSLPRKTNARGSSDIVYLI